MEKRTIKLSFYHGGISLNISNKHYETIGFAAVFISLIGMLIMVYLGNSTIVLYIVIASYALVILYMIIILIAEIVYGVRDLLKWVKKRK